jgi:hypothetical protein
MPLTSTGTALYPSATTYPGSSVYPGQGTRVTYRIQISTDDALVSSPVWSDLGPRMRGISVNRGRPNEFGDIDAATATITLDNRDRALDPEYTSSPYYPNLRPMNRVWVTCDWAGVTYDIFKGYVENYGRTWPEFDQDAIMQIVAVDEYKPLALEHLPTTTPPRATYHEVVEEDKPSCYWRLGGASNTFQEQAVVGPTLATPLNLSPVAMTVSTIGAVIGEALDEPAQSVLLVNNSRFLSDDLVGAEFVPPDLGLSSAFTIEHWLEVDTLPAGAFDNYMLGPLCTAPGNPVQYSFRVTSTGTLLVGVADTGSILTVTSTVPVVGTGWRHIVVRLAGGTLQLLIDGGVNASTAMTNPVARMYTASSPVQFQLGYNVVTVDKAVDELAIYSYALADARIAAHYTAGRQRGYPVNQLTGDRIGAVLDTVVSHAPRDLDPGERVMTGSYMVGQPPLNEMLDAAHAEAGSAMLFTSRNGTISFRDSNHRSDPSRSRSFSPQWTFGDQPNIASPFDELGYIDIAVDYSESFLWNSWNLTREGASTTITREDTASVSRYFRRSQSVTSLKVVDDTTVGLIGDDMLAKYKDPMVRVTGLTLKTSDPDVLLAGLTLELGDCIRVLRSPNYTGTRIDQTSYVQGIQFSQNAGEIAPTIQLSVSPV